MPRAVEIASTLLLIVVAPSAMAHDVYLANDNHTDYGWNASPTAYDAAMLSEVDYYLNQIDLTAGNPVGERARYNLDCWWYVYLYEQNRTPTQFARLTNAIRSGSINVPLNPFVTLYGALSTEGAIRSGYYPAQLARRFNLNLRMAQYVENHTNPWGLASLWAGSEVDYSWKGVCNCSTQVPFLARQEEVFWWRGPDGRDVLMKWYQIQGDNRSWGGYAEARNHLTQAGIQAAINRFSVRPPLLPVTGLFGGGWDDVLYQSTDFVTIAQAWNAAHPGGDRVIVSNQVDYFDAVVASGVQLPVVRGGWGNDWDRWPAAMSAETGRIRASMERLRTIEAILSWIHAQTGLFWPSQRAALESAYLGYFKYFEHGWSTVFPVVVSDLVANKQLWTADIENGIATVEAQSKAMLATYFDTPNEDQFIVFNPLAFTRTDYADFPVIGAGPYVVTDVGTGSQVENQVVTRGTDRFLRILARNVPSLGFRRYRYVAGTGTTFPAAATISAGVIENVRYRVTVGSGGELTQFRDKLAARELVQTALNDIGLGGGGTFATDELGPVTAAIRVDVPGNPPRRIRVRLIAGSDRVEIENEILGARSAETYYRFDVTMPNHQIHFEEVGAIARPGLTTQGGDFLPGTGAQHMTLNHFVSVSNANYDLTLSNWDAYLMRVGLSSITNFDLTRPELHVLALGNPAGSDIFNQAGATYFVNRFALRGRSGVFSASDSMRMSLAHQNPLTTIALPRNSIGGNAAATGSLLSVTPADVLVTAFKPAEEGNRGFVVRLWALDGNVTATIDASAFSPGAAHEVSLVETDISPLTVQGNGNVAATLVDQQIGAYRLVPGVAPDGGVVDAGPPPDGAVPDAGADSDAAIGDGGSRDGAAPDDGGTPNDGGPARDAAPQRDGGVTNDAGRDDGATPRDGGVADDGGTPVDDGGAPHDGGDGEVKSRQKPGCGCTTEPAHSEPPLSALLVFSVALLLGLRRRVR